MNKYKSERKCEVCKTLFVPKKIDSKYCTPKCGEVAYRNKKADEKRDEQLRAISKNISDKQHYISVPEAVALFDVATRTLYRLIRLKKIPSINLGTRLIRIERATMEKMFTIRQTPIVKKEEPKAKLYSLEPEDCYTIGEIIEKFGRSNTTVYTHIRKYSIPTRQIGKYVYAPKSEIDKLYK